MLSPNWTLIFNTQQNGAAVILKSGQILKKQSTGFCHISENLGPTPIYDHYDLNLRSL